MTIGVVVVSEGCVDIDDVLVVIRGDTSYDR